MSSLTNKENYLRMLRGETPERVPVYSFGRTMPGVGENPANIMIEPPFLAAHRFNGGGPDLWGVNYVGTYETGNQILPEPNNFILDDITRWRDVIKAPSLENIDWEAMVERDLKFFRPDRNESAVSLNLHFGYFQTLVSFMGFENGMMAMYEEPEHVHELIDYVADFYISFAENYIDFLKPDILTLMDDTAAWGASFISPEMYREFLLPSHKRYTDMARDRGLFATMHNCGKCEVIIDQLVEIGINLWEPAQTCNDVLAVMEKYPIAVAGAWDARGRLLEQDVTEEEIRQSVRGTMDKYAPGGRYAWFAAFLGPLDDERIAWKNTVLMDEVHSYGQAFYK